MGERHARHLDHLRALVDAVKAIYEEEACALRPGALEALSRLAELGAVDVVLVDWTMPGMDGMTFVHQVRAEAAYEEMRVVMITSESDPAQIFHALMAGVDEYATKPITREALAEKLGLVGLVEQD